MMHRDLLSRASGATLIVRSSPRPRQAPLTAQLSLSGAEAVPTWDTIVTREVVLMPGMNPRRASISFDNKLVYVSSDRMNRFQTRVGFGGERENYVYKSKGIWAA
jgi:hypothetical protein